MHSITVAEAQRDMRYAHRSGAPGMLVSATVWLVAGLVALRSDPERAIWVLFAGGVLIHPAAVLLGKALGSPGKHAPGNPFGHLAFAGTIWMILSLPLAYAASRLHVEWFFPAMLFVIGGRYLTFSTIFGLRTFWLCGGALALAGYLLGRSLAAPAVAAFTGAAIEAGFAATLFLAARRNVAPAH
jgi:hypothetical protein